jgi:hypothetical protein
MTGVAVAMTGVAVAMTGVALAIGDHEGVVRHRNSS